MKNITCPTCGVHRLRPRELGVRQIPWRDDCACSDGQLCVAHSLAEPDKWPDRPSDVEMQRRAEQRYRQEVADYDALRQKFEQVAALEHEVKMLRERLLQFEARMDAGDHVPPAAGGLT